MASTEDDVVVRLRLKDVAQFIADVKSGKLAIDDLEKKIGKAGRTASQESDSNTGGFGKLGKVLGGLKWYAMGAVGSLASAAVGVGAFAIKSASDLQQVQISFETLLGSARAARTTLGQLQDFAIATPFQLPAIEEASKLFLAYKFNLASLLPTLRAVGDASAGLSLGDEGLTGIMNVLGQMKAATVVHGQDILQLTSRGIMAKDYLEQAFHLTPQQFDKAEQAGKISAAAAIPVILRGMEQQFKGQMANQAKSLAGVASNFPDAIRKALTKVVNPYIPAMTQWLQQAIDLVSSKPFQSGLSNAINSTIAGIKIGIELGRQVVDSIRTAISTGDWGPIGAALGTKLRDALIGGGGAAGNVDWYSIGKTAFSGVVTFALGFASALFDPTVWWGIIKSHWLDVALIVVTILTDGFGGVLGKLGAVLAKLPLVGFIGRWIMGLSRGITTVRGPIMKFVGRIASAIGDAFIKVWPEMGTRLWYWFTRIGEFFTKDVPGIKGKVLKWVSDLVPRAVEGMFTAIFKVIEKLAKPLRSLAKTMWKPIGDAFGAVVDWITQRWSQFFGWLGGLPVIGGLFGGGSGGSSPSQPGAASGASTVPGHGMGPVPGHAMGGIVTRAHTAWVGERGPELLTLPRGSSVIPLPRVPEFAGGRGPIHVHVMVDKREIAQAVYDDMGDRVARR